MGFRLRWLAVLSGISLLTATAAAPSGRLELREGRTVRSFVVAADELSVRDPEAGWHLEAVSPGDPASSRARLARANREVSLVLYPVDAERNEGTRRTLANTVVVETRPGTDPGTLPLLVEGGHRVSVPAFSRRLALYEADDSFGAVDLAQTLQQIPGVVAADPELGRHHVLDYRPNDPYFNLQWHLEAVEDRNGGTAGIDIGVVPAWDKYRGAGIIAAVVDDGMEYTHPDLAANVRLDLGYDFLDGDPNPAPRAATNGHGTSVAGLLAGIGDNSLGSSGVAFQSKMAALRLIDTGTLTSSKIAAALAHRNDIIQIKNNSWGPPKAYADLVDYSAVVLDAVESGSTTGRGGRGVIYVFSAGNFGVEGDNVNYASLKNRPDVIPVGAMAITGLKAGYSTPGAPLLLCTPGGDLGSRAGRGILTTDRVGINGFNTKAADEHSFNLDYTQYFNGTSAAAPVLSGVIALMLQANSELGWRDVQEILIRTATKNSPTDTDWRTNGAGFAFNHSFGAGLAHAGRATALAAQWKNLPPQTRRSQQEAGLTLAIPDNTTNGLIRSLTFSGSPIRVEHVQVTLDIAHPSRGELAVSLISPSGMVSRLAERHKDANANYAYWTFLSRRHWGESSTGTWKVLITDTVAGKTGTLRNVRVELLGASLETLTFAGSVLAEAPGLSNGNGGADPGETLAEIVSLRNSSGSDLAGVNATFTTGTPGVTLLNTAALYPVIAADRTESVNLQYRLAKNIPCGTVLEFTQYITAGTTQITNRFTRTLSVALSQLRTTNTWEGHELIPLAIPDLTINQATNRVVLADNPVLESVEVSARIDHSTIGDLEISLLHPDQTEVALMLHRGGDNPNLGFGPCGQGEARTRFADSAALPILAGAVPFQGSFRPEEPLATFQGKPANGAWVLRIADTYEQDSGTLLCWSLTTVTRTLQTECTIFNLGPTVSPLTLTMEFNRATNGVLTGIDGDGDPLKFLLVSPPAHGILQLGLVGDFTYTPATNYSGPDSFTYRANDGYSDSAPATVSLIIAAPPAPPSLNLGPLTLTADGRFRMGYHHTGGAPVQLEQSSDLVHWSAVTLFTAGGATEYVEPTPVAGTKFYRLR